MFFSLCLHYTHFYSPYNKQKRLRDKSLITEPKSVKSFIRSAGMIKSEPESGKRFRHGTFDQLGELVHDRLRILPHIVFDPVEHQPDKYI